MQNNTKHLNIIKLIIILAIIIIAGLWYNNRTSNERFTTPNTTIPNTTIANILPPIATEINNGYNNLNDKRFATLDNQMRLDKLNDRVNKLLENIQQSFKLVDKPTANPMTFY